MKVREKRVRRIEWERLAIFLKMERYHHYCRGRVATQFCSFTPKKSSNNTEWMASHDERHFGSFDKLCSAATHTIKDHYASAHLKGKESVNIQIYYPILVVSGELLDVRQMRKGLTIVPANHIHFIQSYIVDGQERQYHVDVVTERYFPRLLRKIEEEAATTARIMRRRARILRESIDSITASVRGLRSPEAIRARLELPNFS